MNSDANSNMRRQAGGSHDGRVWSVVDLFSGAGGMSHGFKADGRFKILAAVDKQVAKPGRGKSKGTWTDCNLTYERNIGIAPIDADLFQFGPADLMQRAGLASQALDVLVACPPCTGFSQKNAQNHIDDDPRNGLVERTADFVDALMPQFLVMENVKELLQGSQAHHFVNLRERLQRAGYSVWAEVHDLSRFGLPQRRRRTLVIARRGGVVCGPTPSAAPPKTVRDTIFHLPPIAAGKGDVGDSMHVTPGMTTQVLERIRAIPRDGGSWADVMNDRSLSEKDKRRLLTPAMFTARPGSFPDVYGRLAWDRPAPTITRECGHVGNGRYAHPEQDRLLSVREMALLQGFPEDYIFEGVLSARYNQIGDAVPPLVSRQIAQTVGDILAGVLRPQDRVEQLVLTAP